MQGKAGMLITPVAGENISPPDRSLGKYSRQKHKIILGVGSAEYQIDQTWNRRHGEEGRTMRLERLKDLGYLIKCLVFIFKSVGLPKTLSRTVT